MMRWDDDDKPVHDIDWWAIGAYTLLLLLNINVAVQVLLWMVM